MPSRRPRNRSGSPTSATATRRRCVYHAATLSDRLSELEAKLGSADAERVRGWFKALKDHVAGDLRMSGFAVCPYYEGVFAVTTIYYTCAYFQAAREVRYSLPFLRDNPVYSERLSECLGTVSATARLLLDPSRPRSSP
jgi:hypothetical protein